MIIINKFLGYNSQSIYKYNWENLTTIYIVSYMATHKICQTRNKIIRSDIKTKIRLNSDIFQILTSL